MADGNERNPNIAYCTYVLNGEPLSELTCEDRTYEAFPETLLRMLIMHFIKMWLRRGLCLSAGIT